nr:SDR family NAD(P)-dependent oxidoreductase [Candidatus Frankia alpina]
MHLWGRREGMLREAAEEASAGRPGRVHVDTVDIRQFDQVDEGMQAIWAEHGPLTSVVNNAGANFIARTEDLSPRAFHAVTSTIMDGSFFTSTAAARRWIADGLPGTILSNLTTWVWTGSAFVVSAAMAKAAVHSMTMPLSLSR